MVDIGVLGGTGPAGSALAIRLADAGYGVMLGSRDPNRVVGVVGELKQRWGKRVRGIEPGDNATAAAARIVVVGTVWDAAVTTVAQHAEILSGKVVVSMANGLVKDGHQFRPVLPPEGSLAQAIQHVAPRAIVAAAFHLIPAAALSDLDQHLTGDVLVVGDDDDGRHTVLDLVDAMADLRGLDAGSIANAVGLETFTAALLTVNLRHSGEGSLRIEGIANRRCPAKSPI